MSSILLHHRAGSECWADDHCSHRIYEEEDVFSAVEVRTESLQNLRELGPPDLVYLIKQSKTNPSRQVYLHLVIDSNKVDVGLTE